MSSSVGGKLIDIQNLNNYILLTKAADVLITFTNYLYKSLSNH